VDGVCCESACDGGCQACAAKKTQVPDGTCALVLEATAGVGVCEGYVCDGKSAGCDGKCLSAKECSGGFTCSKSQCKAFKRVFTTSTTYTGKLGGALGADQRCQERATAAGLPGVYMAWVGDSTTSPNTRFTKATGPYATLTQARLADDWDDLADGSLDNVPFIDEFGAQLGGAFVQSWAGMDHPKFSAAETCQDWTSEDPGALGTVLPSTWGIEKTSPCDAPMRLYCFEQ
jgi:hypothetical protein